MKTKLHILFTLLVIIILFVTCKKYPEDGHRSWQTINKRMSGTFILDKYIVNDIDSTNLISPCIATRSVLKYGKADGNYYFLFTGHGRIDGMDSDGIYGFGGSQKDIIYLSYGLNPGGDRSVLEPFKGSDGGWQILKLTKDQFWIKQAYSNYKTEVHLKKIHQL